MGQSAISTRRNGILVNNAAVYPCKPFEDYTTQELLRVQRINADMTAAAAQLSGR